MQSLIAAHTHYTSLLRRVGRCLSFGCSPSQVQAAASLAPAITSCWPWAFLKKDYYITWRPRPLRRLGNDPHGAVIAVAVRSNVRLLQHLLGEITDFQIKWYHKRLQPFRSLTFNKPTTLTCFSRLGDKAQTLETLLPRDGPPLWTEGKTTRLTIQTAVFSASMTPLALVTNVISVHCRELRRPLRWSKHGEMLLWQADTVRKAARELGELERRVRELEQATWDREGAVEDTGGR